MRDLLRLTVTKVVPLGLAVGASMEVFMYFTGFWGTATNRESVRRAERAATDATLRSEHDAAVAAALRGTPAAAAAAAAGTTQPPPLR